MPFKDPKEAQTNYCHHLPQPQICDECLGRTPEKSECCEAEIEIVYPFTGGTQYICSVCKHFCHSIIK